MLPLGATQGLSVVTAVAAKVTEDQPQMHTFSAQTTQVLQPFKIRHAYFKRQSLPLLLVVLHS